jgi:hypothetical protein
MLFLTWVIRYGHVAGAALWVGGYALLAFEGIPDLARNPQRAERLIALVRLLTYAGTLVLGFGIVLITRTRGFGQLAGTAWGVCILLGMLIAVTLLGLGDGAIRPAILRSDMQRARRFAVIGFALAMSAIGLMTGATYLG